MFLEIVSPEKTLFTGDVSSVQLPGSEGSFQILNNHAPIVSTLKKGEIKLRGSFDNDSAENILQIQYIILALSRLTRSDFDISEPAHIRKNQSFF